MNFNQFLDFIKQYLVFPEFRFSDILEILILIFIFFKLIKEANGTRSLTVFKGILLIGILYLIANVFKLTVITNIFDLVFPFFLIGLLIIFQSEIKKFLEQIGHKRFLRRLTKFKFKKSNERFSTKSISELTKACFDLAKTKTGVLIVIEMDTPLQEYVNTGIQLDGIITSQLLINIFEKNTPLHDGAVIIQNDRISAATCYLPLSENANIDKDLGTRHRAGIGMTESNDSIVLIVSEETGAISIAEKGKLQHDVSEQDMIDFLSSRQLYDEIPDKTYNSKNVLKTVRNLVISCFVGVISWLCLINYFDPVATKTFNGVPVEIINEEILTSIGQAYEISSGNTTAIQIKGKRSIIDKVKLTDVSAKADLSTLSLVNSMNIKPEISSMFSQYVDLSLIGNTTTTVKLDEIAEIELPIEIKTIGKARNGYYVNELIPNHSTIIVSGVKSKINTLNSAVVSVNINDAMEGFTATVSPVIYDKNGAIIKTDKLILNYTDILLTSVIYKEKTVPLNIAIEESSSNRGKMIGYSSEVEKITIAGEEDILKHISSIDITYKLTLDEDSMSNNIIKTIDLNEYMPEDIIYVSDSPTVNIDIQYQPYVEKSFTIPIKDINIKNPASDYEYKISNTLIKVMLLGSPEIIEDLTIENLAPYINVYGLSEGESIINLKYENKNVIAENNATVLVNITKN